LTGPNGLTTTWEYDALGRQAKEARADGTTTTTNYEWWTVLDTTACYCTFGFVAKTVVFISGGKRFISIWRYGFTFQ
jgi:YD repeat-containing protein